MAVIYEDQPNGTVKAYSDQHKKIFGGFPEAEYDVVYDPKDAHRTYVETDNWIDSMPEQTTRVFSKMYLELALFKAGLLEAVDNFIDSQTITNEQGQTLPLRRLYDTALTFSEDNEYFDKFKSELQTILGLTDGQVEEILSNCIARTP